MARVAADRERSVEVHPHQRPEYPLERRVETTPLALALAQVVALLRRVLQER